MKHAFDSDSCAVCETVFNRLAVEYDEVEAPILLEVGPSADPTCGKLVCAGCDQFICDGCGGTFGTDQRVWIANETDQPLHCCEACAYESKPVCPCCDEHAHMRLRENDIARWYECEACGAKLDEAEITAANREPIPACLVEYELVGQAQTVDGVMEAVRVHETSSGPNCVAMNEVVMPVRAQRETRTATPPRLEAKTGGRQETRVAVSRYPAVSGCSQMYSPVFRQQLAAGAFRRSDAAARVRVSRAGPSGRDLFLESAVTGRQSCNRRKAFSRKSTKLHHFAAFFFLASLALSFSG